MREGRCISRVLLVGFMASGKTRVGQALAEGLGWSFRDFDEEVCFRIGLPIPEIFRQHGEALFRETEKEVGVELLGEEAVVLASGGGWPAVGGRMDTLPTGTLSVWLKVSAEEAVRRAAEEGPTRPLLAVENPVARAKELLSSREEWYGKADYALDTHLGSPGDLAEQIQAIIKKMEPPKDPST